MVQNWAFRVEGLGFLHLVVVVAAVGVAASGAVTQVRERSSGCSARGGP